MAIQVTCPKCLKRFNVADAHAGKTGACPSCKGPIKIPEKSDEVVIHAPENYGPKDASGRATLKPLTRKEFKLTPVAMAIILSTILIMFAMAFMVGRLPGGPSVIVLGLGALIVAVPVVFVGYGVLRNDELGAHEGRELWIRVTACAAAYGLLWGVYWAVQVYLLGGASPEMFQLAFIAPAFVAAGGAVALASLELDFTNACLHYAFYLLVTILLRVTMGLGPV